MAGSIRIVLSLGYALFKGKWRIISIKIVSMR